MLKIKSAFAVLVVAALPLALSGCPAIAVGAATGGALITNDERTTGALVEDETIELKIRAQLHQSIGGVTNINATSYNRRVLLTGQAPTKQTKKQALALANGVENVRTVLDQVTIGGPSSLASRAADAALTAKAKFAICRLQIQDFSCLDVKIVTEQGVLYLLGLVSKQQAAIAIDTVRNVSGVIKVVKVFEFR